jgi:hypothetical protein
MPIDLTGLDLASLDLASLDLASLRRRDAIITKGARCNLHGAS